MIDLDTADDFTAELAQLMEKYNLGVFIGDCQELYLDFISVDDIDRYRGEILDNTPRK
tara:strand:+ start:20318 stop:20491 length:174 start_codon:yes stop_codon:yes gene_type:complete